MRILLDFQGTEGVCFVCLRYPIVYTYCADKDELLIFLLLPLQCWYYRHVLSCLVLCAIRGKTQGFVYDRQAFGQMHPQLPRKLFMGSSASLLGSY